MGMQLCPTVFSWEPSEESLGSVQQKTSATAEAILALTTEVSAQLDSALATFLAETFKPWVTSQGQEASHEPPAAWLVVNDGEAFSLAQPLLDFGRSTSAREGWC